MNSEPLRDMLIQLETITKDLNESIDKVTKANNELTVAKAEESKNKHK